MLATAGLGDTHALLKVFPGAPSLASFPGLWGWEKHGW